MRIDISKYQEHYHDKNKNKLVDNWQEGIRLLPFTSNPTSAVDKGSGLAGATGAFFRILEEEEVQAIENFQVTENVVRSYLIDKRKMNESQADEFILMLRDIMLVSGALNVTDVSFLKYIPLVPNDDMISDKNKKKYRSGQSKLANLLASMIDGDLIFESPENKNLFTRLLKEALLTNGNGLSSKKKIEEKYYILPFIAKSFNEDFKWMMEQDHSAAVRYIHLLLHFYVCFNLIQTLARLSHKERDVEKPFQFYFILNSEKASVNHDAVLQWRQIFPKTYLDKIFGRSQALDILNCVLGGNVGFYPDVMALINQTPFEDNKTDCEELLGLYQKEKREVFSNRNSESGSIEEIDVSICSYEDFIEKLEYLCRGLQSPSYNSRMHKKVNDLLGMRFLQQRRGNYVLTLDNEMLVFLIAMVTKNRRVKLEDMYKGFQNYGIVFNRGSRNAIESYLLKLNLLDRKSDSGEAQYVKVIL